MFKVIAFAICLDINYFPCVSRLVQNRSHIKHVISIVWLISSRNKKLCPIAEINFIPSSWCLSNSVGTEYTITCAVQSHRSKLVMPFNPMVCHISVKLKYVFSGTRICYTKWKNDLTIKGDVWFVNTVELSVSRYISNWRGNKRQARNICSYSYMYFITILRSLP